MNADHHDTTPLKGWIMRQKWQDVFFHHWPVSPAYLRRHIPGSLEIDLHGGEAWIGIVAFRMKGIYMRGCRHLSVTPPFAEVNVRTYVRHNGRPGVFFLSLDVDDWASFHVAKRWYRLPYRQAKVQMRNEKETRFYSSRRPEKEGDGAAFRAAVEPSSKEILSQEGTLDHFLTERYTLFSAGTNGKLYRSDISHPSWKLRTASANISENTLCLPLGIPYDAEQAISHFSPGVETHVKNIQRR